MTASPAARFRIHAVAQATGVSEHSLRVWERRYGSFASSRSEGGYRLYSDDDVERIRLIKSLLDSGHAIGEIAALKLSELSSLAGSPAPRPQPNGGGEDTTVLAARARERFLAAMERLDTDAATAVLAATVVAFDPFVVVNEVVGPLLREVGDRWSAGTFTIAQEHATSAIVRVVLGGLLRDARRVVGGRTVVASTPEGELHEFGALLAATVAASAGAHVVYLGPSTPAADLVAAVTSARADAVLLSVVALPPREARRRVVELRKLLPPAIELFVGGAATPRASRMVPGVSVLASLHDVRVAFQGGAPRR
jgi:MerR family transcriptional regulator, light-induced transcriptional regulator